MAIFREIPNCISKSCGDVNSTVGHVFANAFSHVRGYIEWIVNLNKRHVTCGIRFILLLTLPSIGSLFGTLFLLLSSFP